MRPPLCLNFVILPKGVIFMDLDDIFGESRYESRKKSHKNEHINQQVLKDLAPLSSKERIFVEQLELEQASDIDNDGIRIFNVVRWLCPE